MITGSKKACVIGWPISHSRSPMIHGFWLRQYGIDGSYEKIPVEPQHLPAFLDRIRTGEFVGCNVTIPHKEAVYGQVTPGNEQTRLIGAVNTVYMDDGCLTGVSTDGEGFVTHLRQRYPTWVSAGRTIAVIGAGGAARAIIAQFQVEGAGSILLTNRTLEKAHDLSKSFSCRLDVLPGKDFEAALPFADLLINTTSLGMVGQPPLQIDLSGLARSAIVADIVYVPLETALLRQASKRGNPTLDGLGMLLHQAVPGFEKWFGIRPDVTGELRQLIVDDIDKG